MAKKVTYSRRHDKRQAPHDPDFAQDVDASHKRPRTINSSDSLLPTGTRRRSKSASLLKNSLKKFSGPTSVPDEGMDLGLPKLSSNKITVFDKALNKIGDEPLVPKNRNIYGSRADFTETMKDVQKWKQSSTQLRNEQLPTPPVETQKTQCTHQQTRKKQGVSGPNGSPTNPSASVPSVSTRPIETAQISEKAIIKKQTSEGYQPRVYSSKPTRVPHSDLIGGHISKKSRKARM